MPQVRSFTNGNKVTEWTDEINDFDLQYGLFNSMGLYDSKPISSTTFSFDRTSNDLRIIPTSNRRSNQSTKGRDRTNTTSTIGLQYFKHEDSVGPEDIQDMRSMGTEGQALSLGEAISTKLIDLRLAADQTMEYLKITAAQGIMYDPKDGSTVLHNSFTEFGATAKKSVWDLASSSFDFDSAISNMKSHVSKNLLRGGSVGMIEVCCGRTWFNALVANSRMRDTYIQYANVGAQVLRDNLASYEKWGVVDQFFHRGVRFFTYDAEFIAQDGTTLTPVTATKAFVVVKGVKGLYRGYFGPANKLSGANKPGAEMFAYQYADPKDAFHDLELEFSPHFMMTSPSALLTLENASAGAGTIIDV